MSQRRGIAPVSTEGIKFTLCAACVDKKVAGAGCCLRKCKSCNKSMQFILVQCSRCSAEKGLCQRCGGSLQKEAPAKPEFLSLRKYLEDQAAAERTDVESYIINWADTVTEGNDQREARYERLLIKLATETKIDPADLLFVRSTLSDAGYDERTRNITIGEIVASVQELEEAS